ncbi:MAG: glycosyltransferase [Micromonosporaceae bacterium]|jgi:D-inositol-3-phosphate glycosyltransferase
MRIALISEHASPLAMLGGVDAGGQNAHVAELSTALAARGHQVRVYTRRDGVGLPTVARVAGGFEVVHVPAGPPEPLPKDHLLPHMSEFGRALERDWDRWTPDVAHAHFWMSGLAALRAGARCGVPVVQTFHALGTVKRRHQGAADTSPPGRIGYERLIGRTVHRVVAQCRDEVGELIRMEVPPSRISVVPSGVDPDRFTPDGPAVATTPGRPRILSVGRLVERKGFADLIRALPSVPDAELVVIGGPSAPRLSTDPVAVRLRRLAAEVGVEDRVRLVGGVPRGRMPMWYRSADLVACAPWYEPFGLTPLEAMACDVPVVATAVGGLADTVVDGVTGRLVRPRDPAALAAALRELLADPHRRRAYGSAAGQRVRRHYSWHSVAGRLEEVYRGVREAAPDEPTVTVVT